MSRAVKKPKKDYSRTRDPISTTKLGKLAETLGLKKGLSRKQLMTELATLSQKSVRQALKRVGIVGAAAGYLIDKIPSSGDAAKFVMGVSKQVTINRNKRANVPDFVKVGGGTSPKSKGPLPRPKNITKQKTTTIRKGDTYTSLAKRYGTTAKKLQELNTYSATKLPIGKTIKLR